MNSLQECFLDFFSCLINYVVITASESLLARIPDDRPWRIFVHPDGEPSTAPDSTRKENLLQQASKARNSKRDLKGGLDFFDIVRIRGTEHGLLTAHPMLSEYHGHVSLGE